MQLCMTDNPNYPDPVNPDLKEFGTKVTAFAKALSAPASKASTSLRKQTRAELIVSLNGIAKHVSITSAGNITVWESSGLSITKIPQPVGILP